jgi:serine/threonine-protein kinase PpkA
MGKIKMKQIKKRVGIRACSVLLGAGLASTVLAASVTEATCPGGNQVCRQSSTGLPLRALPRALSSIYKEPSDGAEVLASNVKAFWPVYVFERKDVDFSDGANPKGWYRVGASDNDPLGWMQAKDILEWKQALVISYRHPGSGNERRQPVLMFKSKDDLKALVTAPDRDDKAKALYAGLDQTPPKIADSLISREPKRFVSIEEKFYMLPVIDFEVVDLFDDEARYLELAAAVPVREGQTQGARAEPGESDTLGNRSFLAETGMSETVQGTKAGDLVFDIKFVMDMTNSMGPYIEGTKEAIKKVAKTVSLSNPDAKVKYGLVGYRDDIKTVPPLGFVTKNFTPTLVDAAQFATAVAGAQPATVGSNDYPEEVYAGMREGINSAWDDNSIKILVLVGDASAHPPGHPQSTTGLDAQQIRDMADADKIQVVAVHLKDPDPRAIPDQLIAETQFRTLARNPGSETADYMAIPAEKHDEFELGIKQLSAELTKIIANVRSGDVSIVQKSAPPSGTPSAAPAATQAAGVAAQATAIAKNIAANALVEYLGQAANPPRDITAWVLDRDLIDPNDPGSVPLDVRVLLKKRELNDLIIALERIVKAVKRSQLTGMQFFDSLQGVVTDVAKGTSINVKDAKRLADSGLLPSWLASLPYRSAILEMNSGTFEALSADERSKLENEVDAKLKLYQGINEDADKWVPLDPRDATDDRVYPLRLSSLP